MAHKIMASWLAREALVVADGAAVLADPGERPLYHYAGFCSCRMRHSII